MEAVKLVSLHLVSCFHSSEKVLLKSQCFNIVGWPTNLYGMVDI